MADIFTVLQQTQTVDLLGGTHVRDVMEIGAETKPAGVFFQKRVTIPDWRSGAWVAQMATIAATIEELRLLQQVAAITYVQDVDPAGILRDMYEITVQSDSGNSTGILRLLDTQMLVTVAVPLIGNLNAQLDATEAA